MLRRFLPLRSALSISRLDGHGFLASLQQLSTLPSQSNSCPVTTTTTAPPPPPPPPPPTATAASPSFPSSFPPTPKNRHPRPPPWVLELRRAATRGDYPRCVAILEERSIATKTTTPGPGYAFEQVMRFLPPRLGLQAFHLARDRNIPPTVGMTVHIIRVYAALGMLRHIENTVNDLIASGVRHHWTIYFHWAAVHAEAGLPDGVAAAAAAAEAAGLEVTTHYQTMMIKALCKSGRSVRALQLLRDIRAGGQVPPEPVWRVLIHCQGQAGHARRAQALFDEMREVGIVPGPSTWTALANAYAECKLPRKAVDVVSAMHAQGIPANTRTYTVLLKACATAGDAVAAHAAVQQMQAAGLKPTQHVWGALIAACGAAGDTPAARAALKAMRDNGCAPGVVQYTALLTAHRCVGDLTGGLQVLEEMDLDGVVPSKETYTEAVMLLGQHGMVVEAEEAFLAMRSQGHSPDQISYNVMIGALLANWVDEGRHAHSPLLLRAEEMFREGWEGGMTRPPQELSHSAPVLRVDLHRQGVWSAQLAMLNVLSSVAQGVWRRGEGGGEGGDQGDGEDGSRHGSSNSKGGAPALMVITGWGLKSGWAPLRETVLLMLRNMGLSVRIPPGNEGTLFVPQWDVEGMVKLARKEGWVYDVAACHRYLVDPRQITSSFSRLDNSTGDTNTKGWGQVHVQDDEEGEDEDDEDGNGGDDAELAVVARASTKTRRRRSVGKGARTR